MTQVEESSANDIGKLRLKIIGVVFLTKGPVEKVKKGFLY